MHEDQATVERRQVVVDDHFLPLAEHPEVEAEQAAVAFGRREALAWRYDLLHQVLVLTQT